MQADGHRLAFCEHRVAAASATLTIDVGLSIDGLARSCWSSSPRVVPGADLLAGLHGRRAATGATSPTCRSSRLDARAGHGRQHPHDLRVLGDGRRLVLPAHRLLVRPAGGRCRREEGVPRHALRRHRLPAGDPADLRRRRARSTSRRSSELAHGRRARRHDADAASRSASSPAPRQVARRCRSTSGCRTRWRARRRSAP